MQDGLAINGKNNLDIVCGCMDCDSMGAAQALKKNRDQDHGENTTGALLDGDVGNGNGDRSHHLGFYWVS